MVFSITLTTLLVFLVAREVCSVSDSESAQRVASFFTVPIIPILMLFVLILALRVITIVA